MNYKVSKEKLLYSIAYYPWIICRLFTGTYFTELIHPYGIIKLWNVIGTIAICVLFLSKKKRTSRLLVAILLLMCSIIVSFDNGNASFLFYTALLIVSVNHLDIDNIIKKTMMIQLVIVLLTICAALAGILPNIVENTSIGGIIRQRYSLGGIYNSYVPNVILSIAIEYIYIMRNKKIKWIEVVGLLFLNLVAFLFTQTRMPFAMCIVTIVFMIILNKQVRRNKISRLQSFFFRYSYIIISLISLMVIIIYTPYIEWLNNLNTILSQRLRLAQVGIFNWGISVFGNNVDWITDPSGYNYIDSSYLNILICYGIVMFVLIIFLLTYISVKADKVRNFYLCLALTLWAIRAAVDPQLYIIWFNPFLLFIGCLNSIDAFRDYYKPELFTKHIVPNK